MSREILFKAKRADNGEWVMGGSIIQFLDDGVRSFYMPQFNEKCICEHDKITDDILKFEDTRFYKVDGDTICQYTGLTDKNGNKIWENDIVKCGRNVFVSWDNQFASWCLTRKGWLYKHFFGEAQNPEDCEVIGNIFDNPDLLEESHE